MKRQTLIKDVEAAGCRLLRHGGNHDGIRILSPGHVSQFLGIVK